MGRNNYFQFKQFRIVQEKSAMKVGTDGVLLGAWINLENVQTVLDVGTGTGLISLMIAQRSDAKITGIEIEKNAAAEATFNVINSPWNNRVSIYHISFQEYVQTSDCTFDMIISNPPFFANALKSNSKNRSLARHNEMLPFYKLIQGSSKLLNENGKLAVIVPAGSSKEFIEIADFYELKLNRKMEVRSAPASKPNRILMEFGFSKSDFNVEMLSILNENQIDYSEEYKNLTRDYYLNF